MRERPILFSGPMIRAILDGRKSQTRRVLTYLHNGPKGDGKRHVPPDWVTTWHQDSQNGLAWHGEGPSPQTGGTRGCGWTDCPYGVPGDRLWVRETYLFDDCRYINNPMPKTEPDGWRDAFYYRADGECCEQIPECACAELDGKTPWKPSIFMPRWASRITLEITDVRVQRLQEISEEDALAEGVSGCAPIDDGLPDWTAKESFKILWDSINAKRHPWAENPFVWALTFRRVNA